jgi:hypothetical protein
LLLLHSHTERREIKLRDTEEKTITVRSERRIEVQTKKVTNQDESPTGQRKKKRH